MAKGDSGTAEEENPFIVKNVKKKDEKDTRKGMKTSDEIKIYDVGDAPVVEYVDVQKKEVIEYKQDTDIIELDADTIKKFDITRAKTVEINGRRPREDLAFPTKADFKSLRQSKFDEKQLQADIKRNIDEYKLICLTCRGKLECPDCGGKGKKGFLFKCAKCKGSGMCPDCEEFRKELECPNCLAKISVYATFCKECGAAFSCPNCFTPLPSSATRCIRCRMQFTCQKCKAQIIPARDGKCPRCGTKEWFKKPEREVKPIRETESA